MPIGVVSRHPDFVLLNPRRGVLILKLLYVAMTRAMDQLILTSSKESPFVSRIQQVNQAAKSGTGKGIVSGILGLLGR